MSEINIQLKTYEQLQHEIIQLNTDKYLLQQENKQLKEVIEGVREVINGHMQNEYAMCKAFDEIEFILDKAKENK